MKHVLVGYTVVIPLAHYVLLMSWMAALATAFIIVQGSVLIVNWKYIVERWWPR